MQKTREASAGGVMMFNFNDLQFVHFSILRFESCVSTIFSIASSLRLTFPQEQRYCGDKGHLYEQFEPVPTQPQIG
jgi:hypothetical protein